MCKKIGILGGMGPLATLDLFEKIIKNTPANKDQDHLCVIIYNNPKIISRVRAYFKEEKNLILELQKGAVILEQAGADFILMACHTSHIWLEKIQNIVKIPFCSIIENTAQWIHQQEFLKEQKILLLATQATVKSNLYQKAFQSGHIELISPTPDQQEIVSSVIDQVKAGFVQDNPYLQPLVKLLDGYKRKSISVILGGCTEIPILFPFIDESFVKIDPTLLLAKTAIERALEETLD